jgi:hypothetical protein
MATGDNLKPTKAVVATVLGFLAPGASYLLGVDSDGISSTEWVHAGILCVAGGLLLGGSVFAVENKPKDA